MSTWEARNDPEYFMCDFHHGRLRLIDSSSEAKLLARESHQLLHDTERYLKASSEFMLALRTMSVCDSIPTLKFYVTGDSPTAELQAFVKLVRHSRKLDAWPDVKTAFWLTISQMQQPSGALPPQITAQLIPCPLFPRFMLCIASWPGRGGSPNRHVVYDALCDAVCDVLTTAATETEAFEEIPQARAEKPSIEISFGWHELLWERTHEQMELIESLLDRLLRSPTLLFKIATLDFTNTVMGGSRIKIAAQIVAKCKSGFYQVEQINMDRVIPWYGFCGRYWPGETPREFRELASSTQSLPRFWSFQPPSTTSMGDCSSSILQKVSLSGNALTPTFFPQHFSALRYSCSVTQDLTDYSISIDRHHIEEVRIDSWRWLAFGLFYPRPKRFAQAYKLRTIGKFTIGRNAVSTIVNTLRNPVAQLVYNGLNGDNAAPDCVMVCTVKEGATIEVFVSGLKQECVFLGKYGGQQMLPIEPWHKILLETSEFEALCERDDGSVCVVVPGSGLGWVSKDDVVVLEREPLDLAWGALDGMYDMAIRVGRVPTPVSELEPLFKAIGRQIKSLRFQFTFREGKRGYIAYRLAYSSSKETVIKYIQDHCTTLQHLRLDEASEAERSALRVALQSSNLRSRLLTLNLNNQSIDDAGIVRLATVLGETTIPLTLQELRINCHSHLTESIASLHDLLSVNRTLRLLEIYGARHEMSLARPPRERLDAEARLDAVFQGQLLRSYSPMDVKLAFLSAVNDDYSTCGSHGRIERLALPGIVLSNILAFAASIETRRVIAWNPSCIRYFR